MPVTKHGHQTTLVRHLVQTLDPMCYQVIYLSQVGMKPRDFYGEMLRHLGEEPLFSLTKAKRLFEEILRTRVEQGDKSLVVIIDEAQDITPMFSERFCLVISFLVISEILLATYNYIFQHVGICVIIYFIKKITLCRPHFTTLLIKLSNLNKKYQRLKNITKTGRMQAPARLFRLISSF
ncbi:ATP-binding protein [Syntrophaceticus schinkii]|jgi:hypothetical protein|uniref:ORC1/DEAH AAA+ ATPase domain-containing protein n=1 Tax=Syntrophaceticus schinkii TaxID=499207 RepID=A0A0B7MCU2_9FIRM|nr:ATP-binding protein [Syntrophaceticus schinkii]MDD2359897.1 ATP-binding protein [Syntrophaceticus schinkii]CEO87890.1 hypothetical protein SSCH_1330009 [Syntrophaceticus schinkii]